jgi:tetratricopeptide (TPR) repeat protein
MKKTLTFVAVLMLAAAGAFAQATAPAAAQAEPAKTAADLIAAGDELFAKFDDKGALALYEQAAKLEPENFVALWKTAKGYIDVGDRMTPKNKAEEKKQIDLYIVAEGYAKKAIKINPNDSQVHFLNSAAMGMHALQLGKKQQIAMSKEIKAEIEKAIELDPKNDLAIHAFARWQRRMAEIGGVSRFFGGILYGSIPKGSFEESEKLFKQAIALKPDYSNHHLELGRTFLAIKKKKDLAAKEFELAIACPISTSKCQDYIDEAKAELAKLKKK